MFLSSEFCATIFQNFSGPVLYYFGIFHHLCCIFSDFSIIWSVLFCQLMIIPWVAPYLLGVIHIALTGSVYTTIAVAVERCVTVCAPFTDIKV